MLDINGGELIVLFVVAALVVGPQRLPAYAEQLAALVRRGREWISQTRSRLDEEAGDLGVDWEALDPRKYDPRRIVRDALIDDTSARRSPSGPVVGIVPAASAPLTGPAPFDDEAT